MLALLEPLSLRLASLLETVNRCDQPRAFPAAVSGQDKSDEATLHNPYFPK
jgi:hypothetical protein